MNQTWTKNEFQQNGSRWVFKAGLGQYVAARTVAQQCDLFTADDEDEQIDDELRSCYNCQYRRWMMESFECVALTQQLSSSIK
ncbi:hypothetical protein ACWXWU_13215 [Shewanella sp. A14]